MARRISSSEIHCWSEVLSCQFSLHTARLERFSGKCMDAARAELAPHPCRRSVSGMLVRRPSKDQLSILEIEFLKDGGAAVSRAGLHGIGFAACVLELCGSAGDDLLVFQEVDLDVGTISIPAYFVGAWLEFRGPDFGCVVKGDFFVVCGCERCDRKHEQQ